MSVRYYPLINKIITNLNLRGKLPFSEEDEHSLFSKPFITVAREPGSGGAPVAKAVAKKLGFTFVDKQIIDEVAKSTRKRKEIIKQIDEKDRTKITDLVHSLLNKEYVDDIKYLTELAKVILSYANQGHVVILGRGGNFITPAAKGLHVRFTAPYDVRVQRAMEYEGHSKKKAKEVIAEIERERRAFVKQYLSHDAKKANAYDLTINTSFLNVKQARDIVIEAFCNKFSRFERYSALLQEGVQKL